MNPEKLPEHCIRSELLCILLAGILLLFTNNFTRSNELREKTDSLANRLKTARSDTSKVLLLNEIASEYFKTLPDTSRILLQNALILSEKINFHTGQAKTYHNLAVLARYCGNYQSAIDLTNMSLKIYERERDDKGKANCFDNLGVIYMEQGFYSKALDLFMKSIALHEGISDKRGVAYTTGNIGIVHKLQGDYRKAFHYFSKSLHLNEQSQDIKGVAKAHNLLGSIYRVQKQFDEAILCYKKSYHLSKRVSDKFGMAFSMEYMADIFQAKGRFEEAIDYNKKSKKLREEIGNTTGVAQNLYNIGNNYFLLKDYAAAEDFTLKSLALSRKFNMNALLQSSFNLLSELYYKTGDYKKSCDYFKAGKQLADTINSMQNAKKITQLVMNIEFEKKQQQHEQNERKKELRQIRERNRQIILRNLSIAGFVFVLVFIFILYRFYRVKVKNNETLLIKNAVIQQKNKEILVQAQQLEQTNKELEKLSIVASETENAVVIANIQGVIEWVNSGFTKLYGYTLEEFISEQGANILKASSYPEIHDAIFECVCNKKSVFYTCKTKTRNGKKIWVQTTLTPILSTTGEVVKMVAIDSDITAIKLAEKEILRQKEELHAQSEQLSGFNRELEKKNLQITDSIEYAKHIQDGILLSDEERLRLLPDSFALYKPRDIVSGDLYWVTRQGSRIYVAVIDCTGHGVSGAFMSMLGYAFLSEIISKNENISASGVLSLLRENIVSTLAKDDKKSSLPYGMDMSLCIINGQTMNIQIAGANCPVYIIKKCSNASECLREVTVDGHKITHYSRKGEPEKGFHLVEVKPSKLPIGRSRKEENSFVDHDFQMEKDEALYLFTDGYSDQFGGPEGWKYTTSGFKNLILQHFDKPMQAQKDIFNRTIEDWRFSHEKMFDQTDDMTILGIKF